MTSRYSVDDYTSALQSLLPRGRVWPREMDSVINAVVRALATAYAQTDDDAITLLAGAFPKTAQALLPEWELTLGLPDDCACSALSNLTLRQQAVVSKLIGTGGQSLDYFISLAASMGYDISIQQYRQARAGLSRCGDALNGGGWPFVWQVVVNRNTGDSDGVLKLLLCRLSEFTPAHAKVLFKYDSLALFNIGLSLTLTNGTIYGRISADNSIDVADTDITLVYTREDGSTLTTYLVTDAQGTFNTLPAVEGIYTAVARAQVFTPMCAWENVEATLTIATLTYSGGIRYDGLYSYRD